MKHKTNLLSVSLFRRHRRRHRHRCKRFGINTVRGLFYYLDGTNVTSLIPC